ncbi:hypothetical protein Saso_20300 [Streptomyces asoensis]|uniref:Uncharacterized protein n=1 Tax=Streptomyces asoensis TaxID=249586 RepID=A0ABQ3RWZ4_9ACTN|nr:hypothetical protein GCM10010496_12890 [Streptomyces asoensis]GHI60380.1 hypothetical protein Saso_20300 [Streptomyces asoensis]
MVEKSRERWMSGSAMFTMVMSRTTISWHEAMTSSAMALLPPSCRVVVRGAEVGCEGWLMACRPLGSGPWERSADVVSAVGSTVRRYARVRTVTTRAARARCDGVCPCRARTPPSSWHGPGFRGGGPR